MGETIEERWPPDLRAHAVDYAYQWADKARWLRSRAAALLERVSPPPDGADRNLWEKDYENELRMAGELSLIADELDEHAVSLAQVRHALTAAVMKPHQGPCGCGECIGADDAHHALARLVRAALDSDACTDGACPECGGEWRFDKVANVGGHVHAESCSRRPPVGPAWAHTGSRA
ncbi:MAG: hypothetical protein JJ863_21250 [Deltaproteobacteria bacterium]|nr:hypothetical protein [Deltaproteobacteria bacterium]